MSEKEPLKTRDQRIVQALKDARLEEQARRREFRSRAKELPALLRRNGLMHSVLFLAAKRGSDRTLAEVLLAGMEAALDKSLGGDPAAYGKGLAKESLGTYLVHWEAAVETSAWLKLLAGGEPAATGETGQAVEEVDRA